MLRGWPDATRAAVAAALLFAAISLPFFIWGGGERSAYVKTFASTPMSQGAFGLLGYSYTVGPAVVMAENSHYFDQTLTQNGNPERLSLYFYSVRPLYAFLAALFAPILGVIPALGFVNYLAWMACAAAAWRFTLMRTRDPLAAVLAVVMMAAGLGPAIHIHDYSPHLLPFATYYLGVLTVYESRVWAERRPLATHLRIGLFLAVTSLAYSTGMVLSAAYLLVAVRRNRWLHVVLAFALGMTAQYAWTGWLNFIQSYSSGSWQWINVQAIEQLYMRQSLERWLAMLSTPAAFVARVWDGILQFSNFEFAPLIVAGLAGWIVIWRSLAERCFDVVFVAMPYLVGLVYLNQSTTRGYLVYGVSLLLYAVVAEAIARGVRASRAPARWSITALAVVLLISQLAWSSGYLWGYLAPAKIFFGFGYRDWIPVYLTQFQPVPAFSITDAEPTPVLFGGDGNMLEAGVFVQPQGPTPVFSPKFGLVLRFPIVLYLCALAAAAISDRRRRFAILGLMVAVLWILPSTIPLVLPPAAPPLFSTFYSLRVPPGTSWHYSVEVGESFVEHLKATPDASSVQFMVPGMNPPFSTTIKTAAGEVLAEASDGRPMLTADKPPAAVIAAIDASRRLDIEIVPSTDAGVGIFGWQRAGLPGRTLQTGSPENAPATVPAFEIRLFNAQSRLLLVGF